MDHRYGRDEMLALFNANSSPPEVLPGREYILPLYLDRAELPLALQPESADESYRRYTWPARNVPPKVGPSNMEFPSQRGRYYSNGRGRGGSPRGRGGPPRGRGGPPRGAAMGMELDNGRFYNTRKDFNNGNYGVRSRSMASKNCTGGYHRDHDANWRASGEVPDPRPRVPSSLQQMQQPPHFGKKLSWREEAAERQAHMELGGEENNQKTWAGQLDSHSPDDLLPECANPDNTAIPSGSFDSSEAFHEEVSVSQRSQSATTVFEKKVPLTHLFSQGSNSTKVFRFVDRKKPGLNPMGDHHLESTKVPLFPAEGTTCFYRDPQKSTAGDLGPWGAGEKGIWGPPSNTPAAENLVIKMIAATKVEEVEKEMPPINPGD